MGSSGSTKEGRWGTVCGTSKQSYKIYNWVENQEQWGGFKSGNTEIHGMGWYRLLQRPRNALPPGSLWVSGLPVGSGSSSWCPAWAQPTCSISSTHLLAHSLFQTRLAPSPQDPTLSWQLDRTCAHPPPNVRVLVMAIPSMEAFLNFSARLYHSLAIPSHIRTLWLALHFTF